MSGEWDGNIDVLFSSLHSLLKKGEYEAWKKGLEEVFSAQFEQYERISGALCNSLKRREWSQFKPMEHLYLRGRYAHMECTGTSIDLIVSSITPHINEQDLTFLEQDVLKQAKKIKIKEVPNDLVDMYHELGNNNNVAVMAYEYFLRPKMEGYEAVVRDYLGKMEELNDAVGNILQFSKVRISWPEAKRVLTKKLLSCFRKKYEEVQKSYGVLCELLHKEYGGGFASLPCRVDNLSVDDRKPLFVEFMDELREYDAEPKGIKVRSPGKGVYILSVEASPGYGLIKPSMYLHIGFGDEFEEEKGETINLTEKRDGVIFKNRVSKQDDTCLEVELEVKPPIDGSFRITSLEVTGGYELLYVKERKPLDSVELAKPSAILL